MNIEYLHYFLDVAHTKSITKAAKLNFISPQGMSRAMNELEKEFGYQLLIRHANRLELAPLGEDLVGQVQEIVDAYTNMLGSIAARAFSDESSGRELQLECQNIAMLALFPHKVQDYILHSHQTNFRESQNSQIRQTILGYVGEDAPPTVGMLSFFGEEHMREHEESIRELEAKGFRYRPFLDTYDQVIVSPRSPLAEKKRLSNADMLSKCMVCTNSHLYSVLEKRFGEKAIELVTPDFSLRRRMVANNSAISFLPAIAQLTRQDGDDYVFRDMEDPYQVKIGFIGNEAGFASQPFNWIRDALVSFYRGYASSGLFTLRDDE